jgi:hypothetical protein
MSLNLRVDKYLDSDGGPPPTVFATIYAVDPESGKKRRDVSVRREQVPISHNAHELKSVSLAPGHYVVEVTMPSGDVLSDRVDVPSAPDVSLVLKAEDSPHEWLGWQHLVGNVSSVSQTLEPRETRRRSRAREPEQRQKASRREWPGRGVTDQTKKKGRSVGGPRASVDVIGGDVREAAAIPFPPEPSAPLGETAEPSLTLKFLNTPLPALAGGPGDGPWAALTEVMTQGIPLSNALNGGNVPFAIQPVVQDDERAVYRVVRGPGGVSGATPLPGIMPRAFIVVTRGDAVELVSLPTPWPLAYQGREAVIEIVVQQNVGAGEFATSITVRDDRLGVLLGFLASGALGAAREIAETAQDFLADKQVNPLAAAAGAYALVGTVRDTHTHDWHAWVSNLCNWFPDVPDGAIQRAQLDLRLRRTPDDLASARHWFKEAYHRGLPFYSMGMRWLLDGLEKLGRSDPEAETMRRAVHRLAWRIHPLSPFTILRLERR